MLQSQELCGIVHGVVGELIIRKHQLTYLQLKAKILSRLPKGYGLFSPLHPNNWEKQGYSTRTIIGNKQLLFYFDYSNDIHDIRSCVVDWTTGNILSDKDSKVYINNILKGLKDE